MRRGDKNPDVLQSILLFLSRLATSCLNRSSFTTLHGPHDLLLITLYPYLGVLVPVVCRRPIFCSGPTSSHVYFSAILKLDPICKKLWLASCLFFLLWCSLRLARE